MSWRRYGKRRRPQAGDRVRLCQRRRYWFFGVVETVHTIDVVRVKLDGRSEPEDFEEQRLSVWVKSRARFCESCEAGRHCCEGACDCC